MFENFVKLVCGISEILPVVLFKFSIMLVESCSMSNIDGKILLHECSIRVFLYNNYRRCGKICWVNIRSFSPMKLFTDMPSWHIGHQYLLPKNSRENFRSKLKNCENHESLAQQIFLLLI